MPKITFKKAFFRIFWKILAKTDPQSLYLCGFPEASVEMEVAPFRALTPPRISFALEAMEIVEMEVAPFRALTHCFFLFLRVFFRLVEMEVAPFRALTLILIHNKDLPYYICRNEGRPYQGIDTITFPAFCLQLMKVEMKVAPIRALTPDNDVSMSVNDVEMKVAPIRA